MFINRLAVRLDFFFLYHAKPLHELENGVMFAGLAFRPLNLTSAEYFFK